MAYVPNASGSGDGSNSATNEGWIKEKYFSNPRGKCTFSTSAEGATVAETFDVTIQLKNEDGESVASVETFQIDVLDDNMEVTADMEVSWWSAGGSGSPVIPWGTGSKVLLQTGSDGALSLQVEDTSTTAAGIYLLRAIPMGNPGVNAYTTLVFV